MNGTHGISVNISVGDRFTRSSHAAPTCRVHGASVKITVGKILYIRNCSRFCH